MKYYDFFLIKSMKRYIQATINNKPPMGVIIPITFTLKPTKSRAAKRYSEPEKKRMPTNVRYKIVAFALSEMCVEVPTNKRNKAWYI